MQQALVRILYGKHILAKLEDSVLHCSCRFIDNLLLHMNNLNTSYFMILV